MVSQDFLGAKDRPNKSDFVVPVSISIGTSPLKIIFIYILYRKYSISEKVFETSHLIVNSLIMSLFTFDFYTELFVLYFITLHLCF